MSDDKKIRKVDTTSNSIGLSDVKKIFEETVKDSLNKIVDIELTIENTNQEFQKEFSSFAELELNIKANLDNQPNYQFNATFFKWTLIIFEALSGYLAIGLLFHAINIGEFIDPDYNALVLLIQFLLAFAFSFAIISFAVNLVKPNIGLINEDEQDKTQLIYLATGLLLALPILNVAMIYLIGLEVENKAIYLISSIFTSITGYILIRISAKIDSEKIINVNELKSYLKMLKERKALQDKAKKGYVKMYRKMNEYDDLVQDSTIIENSRLLSVDLKDVLLENRDFEEWSYDYIEDKKEKRKLRRKK